MDFIMSLLNAESAHYRQTQREETSFIAAKLLKWKMTYFATFSSSPPSLSALNMDDEKKVATAKRQMTIECSQRPRSAYIISPSHYHNEASPQHSIC
jgi:hypothetical protein